MNAYPPAEQEYWLIRKRGPKAKKIFTYEPIPPVVYEKLTPVQNGFGYYGVVLYDPSIDKVQCHLCGKWYIMLGGHVRRAHGVPADDYKEEFELGRQGLCSIGYANRQQEHGVEVASDGHLDGHRATLEQLHSGTPSLRAKLRWSTIPKDDGVRKKLAQSARDSYKNPERRRRQAEHLSKIMLSGEEKSKLNKGKKRTSATKTRIKETRKQMFQHNRDAIFAFISSHPGCSGLDITAELGHKEGMRAHYLRQLKKQGLIYSTGHSANTRYYPSEQAEKDTPQ